MDGWIGLGSLGLIPLCFVDDDRVGLTDFDLYVVQYEIVFIGLFDMLVVVE